jgi:RNA polymerase sigma-70 factor (ECF subfamily)
VSETDRIYRDLGADLRRYVARRVPEAVDDVVQEIFLRIHERIGELREADRLAAWVFRIARSVVVDHVRRKKPVGEPDEALAADEEEPNLNETVASWLPGMLANLPEDYREAVALCEVEGLSQQAIADRLGLSLSGAKSRVQRGRRLLEARLLDCCHLERDLRGNVLAYEPRRPCCVGG